MSKGERISRFVQQLDTAKHVDPAADGVVQHPYYRAFFQCWNAQQYYEAHDVLEQLWLNTRDSDAAFFKGLIQAAGGFVHLQKNFEEPAHPKHARRLRPAVRLFALAEENLEPYGDVHHDFNIAGLRALLARTARDIVDSEFARNPWTPQTAPILEIG